MKKTILFLLLSTSSYIASAQVGVGTTNPQGAFEVVNTTDGMLISRVALVNTTTATILTPTKSEMVYNTATAGDVTPGYYYWETTPTVASDRWIRLANSSDDDWKKIGNAGTTPGTNFIGTTDAQDLRFKTGGTDRLNLSNTTGQLQSYFAGTATDPAFSWNADSNTGILRPAADNLAMTTAGTERMRVLADGRIIVNAATLTQADNQFEVTSTIVGDDAITGFSVGAGGRGVQGNSTLTGIGVAGFNDATGYGVFGSNSGTGLGVYGLSVATTGVYGRNTTVQSGVFGENLNTAAGAAGYGVVGDVMNYNNAGTITPNTTSTGVGIQGQADSPDARALVGINNLGTAIYGQTVNPTQTTSTAAIYGSLDKTVTTGNQDIASVIGSIRSLNIGTGGFIGPLAATSNSAVSGVAGTAASRVTNTNTNSFLFGVIGDVLRDSSVPTSVIPDATGGVLGYNGSNAFGILGYRGTGGATYSVYGGGQNGSILAANGGARLSGKANETTENNLIGLGIHGGFMGGYIKGAEYGLMTKGEEFGMYVAGNTITNKPIIQLKGDNNKRIATYVPTSTTVDISTRGKGKLNNGETFVSFDKNFMATANLDSENINITITPTGATNGVYVSRVTATGFYITENLKGTSNASFNWTAISIQKGFEKGVEISEEILANDFDKNMNEVMHNEGDTETEGKPIYFDGTKIRFERMADDVKNMRSDAPTKKLEKAVKPNVPNVEQETKEVPQKK